MDTGSIATYDIIQQPAHLQIDYSDTRMKRRAELEQTVVTLALGSTKADPERVGHMCTRDVWSMIWISENTAKTCQDSIYTNYQQHKIIYRPLKSLENRSNMKQQG